MNLRRKMIYHPKYCCQCGEKIEQTNWSIFSSSRFCELCRTDFVVQDWAPRAIVGLGLIFSIVAVYGYFRAPDKPLRAASIRSLETATETKRIAPNQSSDEKTAANTAVKAAASTNAANIAAAAQHQIAVAAKQESSAGNDEKPKSDDAPTYFCGAATKKGAPCSRRVKNGGRCWQHAGQAAMLPPEKLLVSR